jgi:hypothetical protein
MPDDFLKAQTEMQDKMQGVTNRYWGFNVGLGLLNVAFASCLLAGGIMMLKMNPKARTFLVTVFAAVIVFEIVRAVVTVFMQLDIAAAMSDVMPRMMMAAGPKGGPGAEQGAAFMGTVAKASAFVGMAFSLGWALAKMVFYGVSACYLRRPNIRRLFEQSTMDRV